MNVVQRFKHSFIFLWHFLTFSLCAAVYFLIFGLEFPFLLRPSRTLAITGSAFSMLYVLMGRVYGGMDIGEKKSKPIIYSFIVSLIVTDLAANLFLSIMNVTVVNEGHFVFESPLRLLLVYGIQLLLVIVLAYAGNGIYFTFNKPASCLVIKQPGKSTDEIVRKISRMRKQFRVDKIRNVNDYDLFDAIDQADTVFFYELATSQRAPLVSYCYQHRKEVFYSVEIADIVAMGSVQTLFDDTPMIHYKVKGLTFEQRVIKRGMDVVGSALGLLILSPVMLVTAIAIKLEDGGPVFYKQPRVTYAGREFNVVKFRSMRVADGNEHRSVTKDDDRITKVGRVIRKFRIDELPQLYNILKSDMSLVGPRPEMVENVEKYTRQMPEFVFRTRAKAGLTGMAQIYGKYKTSPADKLALDLTYIENYNLLLDIKLILRTILVLLTPGDSTEAFEPAAQQKDTASDMQRV